MMHQTFDPNTDPPRDEPPSLAVAALTLTDPRVLHELAYHARGLRSRDELAAVLERRAVDAIRAGDGYSAAHRHDIAAGERERARDLRRWAAALRVVHEASP